TEDGYNLHQLYLNMHIGTHIDFKNHVYAKEEEINFEKFMGKANVIKPNIVQGVILTSDLENKYHQQKYKERILLLDLNHGNKFNTKAYYEHAIFEPSIYNFLKENNITLLGADIPNFSYHHELDLKMHKDLLKSGIHLLENLTNIDKLNDHVYILALPLNIESIEASLVRAIAKNI
ncbi:MAG: cyclase family protein, partial [Candidatus Izemoplasmatales bacterium]|nr:cyclase family protein [Candidatus Izemoplasmatales bacterium]